MFLMVVVRLATPAPAPTPAVMVPGVPRVGMRVRCLHLRGIHHQGTHRQVAVGVSITHTPFGGIQSVVGMNIAVVANVHIVVMAPGFAILEFIVFRVAGRLRVPSLWVR